MIVHVQKNEHGEDEVFIAPVTHTPPRGPEQAMEIPQATKKRLGLDSDQSWVITTEVNRFIWPGPDIRSVPGGGEAYGFLPGSMADALVQKIKKNARDRSLSVTRRDDEVLLEKQRASRKQSPAKSVSSKVKGKARRSENKER